MMSTRLWMLVLVCVLCTDLAYAQTTTGTDTQIPPISTSDNATTPAKEEVTQATTISFFGLQSQRFSQDVQRQITDFILPISVGEHVLNTLHYQAITPSVKAHILFITAEFGNSAQMQMYLELSSVFVDAGYDTMIATLAVGEALSMRSIMQVLIVWFMPVVRLRRHYSHYTMNNAYLYLMHW
ncbi:MAG: hypothetical protein P8Q24_01910 [Glaciecola sp.]|nr:hypothetical protein [Glaciecola sp.]MDG1467904.1 hypothetical protein [Glaciecola sp.]MDG1922449.1 hypothetical protein [Glaciecola sp.]